MPTSHPLKNKKFLITGSAQGLGYELATKMNLQLHVAQQNENGKALRNNTLLGNFERALGVKLKR